jgi:outer membrane protein OmpA-like peptidoglycan-associated protein
MTRPQAPPQTLLRKCSNFCLAVLYGGLLLGGMTACSAVPDAVNPVEWYRGVSGLFEDDDAQLERAEERAARAATPLPGTNKPYPNLATVPGRPNYTPAAERNKVAQGLAADRENARYAETNPEPAVDNAAVDPTPPAAVPMPPSMARPQVSAQSASPRPPNPVPMDSARILPAMPPVQARETPVPVPQTPSEARFPLGMTQFATVFFANNSAVLDADGKRALRTLAAGYKEQGGSMRIVGFASGQATTANAQIANFRIAGQRAEAVAQELGRLGVPMNRMIISSGNAGAADPALARRVEVSLDY